MRATTDVWVHDGNGSPLFVVTGEVTSSLTKALLPLLAEIRKVLPPDARPTVVFDRGGWSPKLFRKILKMDFDLLTYRKGERRDYPRSDFLRHVFLVNGREVEYLLRDGFVRPAPGLELRCVVRLDQDGTQTHIVTSNRMATPVEILRRIGDRWRQENFFKYAVAELGLDAMDSYRVEPDDPDRMIPNPDRRTLEVDIRNKEERILALEGALGREADSNLETARPTARGFKIAHASIRKDLAKLRDEADRLRKRKLELPKRIPVRDLSNLAVKLEVEHKHFSNIVRMAVYRAETAMARLVAGHYRRAEDEGRALLREAFRSSGSLRVERGVLQVTLDPLSAPRRTRAIAALCHDLNREDIRMPGTTLRLRFTIRDENVSQREGRCQEV